MTTRKIVIIDQIKDYEEKQKILEKIESISNAKIHDHKINFKKGYIKIFIDIPISQEEKFERKIHETFECTILSASRGGRK